VIGVRDDTLGALGISPSGAMLVAGTAGSGRSTALATIATALRRADPGIRLVHISPRKTSLTPLPLWSLSLSDPAQIAAFADDVTAQLDAETLKPTQFAVFVENVGELNGSPAEADVDRLVKRALRDDVFVIGESESSTWSAAWTLGGAFKNSKRGLLLVPGDLDGDSLLGTSLGRFKRADLPPGRGFYVQGGRVVKLQVATRDD
jgi:S-DNA-T family DNA segregation ATPase FtsK/SpoIIIE